MMNDMILSNSNWTPSQRRILVQAKTRKIKAQNNKQQPKHKTKQSKSIWMCSFKKQKSQDAQPSPTKDDDSIMHTEGTKDDKKIENLKEACSQIEECSEKFMVGKL
eukprot:10980709-Ditylum_brightwellii.AAC.1